MIEIKANGRVAITTEEAARRLEKTPSAVRNWIHRNEVKPAGYVTKNVPVYYPADLGLEES